MQDVLVRWKCSSLEGSTIVSASSANQRDLWLQAHQRKQMRLDIDSIVRFTNEYMRSLLLERLQSSCSLEIEAWRALNGGYVSLCNLSLNSVNSTPLLLVLLLLLLQVLSPVVREQANDRVEVQRSAPVERAARH